MLHKVIRIEAIFHSVFFFYLLSEFSPSVRAWSRLAVQDRGMLVSVTWSTYRSLVLSLLQITNSNNLTLLVLSPGLAAWVQKQNNNAFQKKELRKNVKINTKNLSLLVIVKKKPNIFAITQKAHS